MAHVEQTRYLQMVASIFPSHFRSCRVLEIGSRNINGSPRALFRDCSYIGLDCTPGRDVDVVGLGHEFRSPEPFRTILSCEALEHDPHWMKTIDRAIELLEVGGLFLFSCASPTRPRHGTADTGPVYGPDPNYYRGLSELDLTLHIGKNLAPLSLVRGRGGLDVYGLGFRPSGPPVPSLWG